MSVLHHSLSIFKAAVSSLSDGWAKYKEKVSDVSDSNQNFETTTSSSKLMFTGMEDLFTKRVQKI